jgi:hypothetical protein
VDRARFEGSPRTFSRGATHRLSPVEGPSAPVEDVVELVRYDPTHLFFRIVTRFDIGHSCSVYGIATQVDQVFVYRAGAAPADARYLKVSGAYHTPRYRALYRQWLDEPRTALWMAGSPIVADAIDREHGRVECVELSRQYLHLSPLVDVA